MTYEQALAFIHGQEKFGIQLGLERMEFLLDRLGHPEKKLRFVHVAGTNGKGTATTMTARCLTTAGYRTGLYTSPYIVDFRERIQVDGEMIPQDDLAREVAHLRPLCDELAARGTPVTEFELITALALRYFSLRGCDVVCLEVGLGGQYDATNIIPTPLVSVIMNIGLDHTDVLGDTIEKIAAEKAGIIKDGGVTVHYPALTPEAAAVIEQRAAQHHNTLIVPDVSAVSDVTHDLHGQSFTYRGERYELALLGPHQVHNAITVIEVITALRAQGYGIGPGALKRGMRDTRIPARLELIGEHPVILLDGAHNEQGAQMLAQALRDLGRDNIVAICGMLADKNYEAALSHVLPLCRSCITVTPQNPRALSAEALRDVAQRYCADCSAQALYEDAIDEAIRRAGDDGIVVVFGSLYLAGAMRPLLVVFGN